MTLEIGTNFEQRNSGLWVPKCAQSVPREIIVFDTGETKKQNVQSSRIYPSSNRVEYAQMLSTDRETILKNIQEIDQKQAELRMQQQKVRNEIKAKRKKLRRTPKRNKKIVDKLKNEIKNLKTSNKALAEQLNSLKKEIEKLSAIQLKPQAESRAELRAKQPAETLGVKKGTEEVVKQAGTKKPYVKPEVGQASRETAEALGVRKSAEEAAENAGKSKGILNGVRNAMKGKKGKVALVLGAAALVAGAVAMCVGGNKDEKPVETENSETELKEQAPAENSASTEEAPAETAATPVVSTEPEEPDETEEPEEAEETEEEQPVGGEKAPESTVQNGDTLESVAERLGCTVEELRELNADKIKKFKTESGKEVEGFIVGEELNLPEKYKKSEGLKNKTEAVKEYEDELIKNFDKIPQALWNQVCTPQFRQEHKLGEYKEAA